MSKYVDYQLQPLVQQIPSYMEDTSNFFRKNNKIEKIPDNYLIFFSIFVYKYF